MSFFPELCPVKMRRWSNGSPGSGIRSRRSRRRQLVDVAHLAFLVLEQQQKGNTRFLLFHSLPRTFAWDSSLTERAIIAHRPRALRAVHLFGRPETTPPLPPLQRPRDITLL